MIIENAAGAYLGPTPRLLSAFRLTKTDPHYDVLENDTIRLILGKCSRLPDDEDPTAGRFGIDFHRALPPFTGPSGFTCDWGEGPFPVNAFNFARFLPRTIRFRQFTANLAFAAQTPAEYEAKRRVYEDFYRQIYGASQPLVVAVPHSGPVYRPPDEYHPFPESEIDAWTARLAVRLDPPRLGKTSPLLVSLHSTDYFGVLLDIGDFGLPSNRHLAEIVEKLNTAFAEELAAVEPAYREHATSYTQLRLQWKQQRWGALTPEHLANISTASRFEVMMLDRIIGDCIRPEERFTYDGLCRGVEAYWSRGNRARLSLNGVFSGRKTANLLNLEENLPQAGFQSAVQVECSRFLAQHHPRLAAAIIGRLVELMSER
ncbi:MAG: hypothetical protein FJ135_16395 [Deltaproteobacteria bacterium]|nr:hypothetical protein [Deltaproteobacteria bacterium]